MSVCCSSRQPAIPLPPPEEAQKVGARERLCPVPAAFSRVTLTSSRSKPTHSTSDPASGQHHARRCRPIPTPGLAI